MMFYFHIVSRSNAIKSNLKHYFTGSPCKYGHIYLRQSSSGSCCFCLKLKTNKKFKTLEELFFQKKINQKIRGKNYYERNKDLTKERSKQWKKENPEKLRQSWSNWRKKDTSKAITFMRDSLRRVLKVEKNGRTEKIVGYTRSELIKNMESKFTKGMSWENHGEWHIDHIKPISLFLLEGIYCPKIINSLDNLQPLWKKENLSKWCNYND